MGICDKDHGIDCNCGYDDMRDRIIASLPEHRSNQPPRVSDDEKTLQEICERIGVSAVRHLVAAFSMRRNGSYGKLATGGPVAVSKVLVGERCSEAIVLTPKGDYSIPPGTFVNFTPGNITAVKRSDNAHDDAELGPARRGHDGKPLAPPPRQHMRASDPIINHGADIKRHMERLGLKGDEPCAKPTEQHSEAPAPASEWPTEAAFWVSFNFDAAIKTRDGIYHKLTDAFDWFLSREGGNYWCEIERMTQVSGGKLPLGARERLQRYIERYSREQNALLP